MQIRQDIVVLPADPVEEIKTNDIPDFSTLMYNCNNVAIKQLDINTFILPTNYNTFYNTF